MKKQMKTILAAVSLSAGLALTFNPAQGAGGEVHLEHQHWSFDGFMGQYDQAALRRGYQVYKEVCAGCHGMDLLAYRNLGDAGGPHYSEDEVKAIAKEYEVFAGPDEYGETTDADGYPLMRSAVPSDYFVAPYANENAALAANAGALPPGLSLMAKARHSGPDYIYNLLINYEHEAPEGVEVGDGLTYNPIFPGGQLAMAQPLWGDDVEYADGTEASIEQEARDVAEFLMWAAEPRLNERKKAGFSSMIFLLILTGLTYWCYRRVWSDVDH